MKVQQCDVAIIGAGPYGLSVAAHLRALGVRVRTFGKAMDTWRSHMPEGMMLKSEGFASNLSAPDRFSTLKAYCTEQGIAYADRGMPIPRTDFVAYADWFRNRHVPELEEIQVRKLAKTATGFALTLETGEMVFARRVVLAVGVSFFQYIPEELAGLPASMVSHSYDHRRVEQFKGSKVVVLGAGASAINLAYELEEAGCQVRLVARARKVEYNTPPRENAHSLWYRLRNPPSPIGQGWRSYFCAVLPGIFYHLPGRLRARAVKSHVHAAGGWYMREKVEGRVPQILGHALVRADIVAGRVRLTLKGPGATRNLDCDHVIAATGYRVDARRLSFLDEAICREISENGRGIHISAQFETQMSGLYAVGMTAMENFGPVLRFMVGTRFVAPRLAAHLRRRIWIEKAQSLIGAFAAVSRAAGASFGLAGKKPHIASRSDLC
ncbi:MAG: NAD(P)/FAD-dependent oxidoreductase [Alphaproteobacteria bacterium]|nr:NAD(P)/FAD-dependent oxidoreductase [Alphaproteobacteria bacterium]